MRERDFNFNSHSSRKVALAASSCSPADVTRTGTSSAVYTWYLVPGTFLYYRIRVLSVISLCLVELDVPFRNLRGLP